MKNVESKLLGIIIIIIGIILGTNALDITNINIFFNGWWTLFIIIPSLIGLISEKDKITSIIFLVIGIILLLGVNDVIDLEKISNIIVPSIIVFIGLSIILKDVFKNKTIENIKEINEKSKNKNSYTATFSSQKIKYDSTYTSTNVDAIFGGVELDLRDINVEEDIVINASAIFGGIDIFVPDNVLVKVKNQGLFGGVSNKTRKRDNNIKTTIYINSTCLFGGIDIND